MSDPRTMRELAGCDYTMCSREPVYRIFEGLDGYRGMAGGWVLCARHMSTQVETAMLRWIEYRAPDGWALDIVELVPRRRTIARLRPRPVRP